MNVTPRGPGMLGALCLSGAGAVAPAGADPHRTVWSDTTSYHAVSKDLTDALPVDLRAQGVGSTLQDLADDVDRAAARVCASDDAAPDALAELENARNAWRRVAVDVLTAKRDMCVTGDGHRTRAAATAPAGGHAHHAAGSTPGPPRPPMPSLIPAPPLERIALRGGGAKGQAYGGALLFADALDALGALDDVRTVAGASVGSIVAAYLACGSSGAQTARLLLDGDMRSALAKDPERMDALLARSAVTPRSARPLLRLPTLGRSAEQLVTGMDDALRDIAIRRLPEDASGRPDAVGRVGRELLAGAPLSFAMLGTLAEAGVPGFRHLAVTAFDRIRDRMIVFDSRDTRPLSEVAIAFAIRGSAAIPVAIAPLEIDVAGQNYRLVDAGVKSNIPLDALYRPDPLGRADGHPGTSARPDGAGRGSDGAQDDHSRTLVVTFSDDGVTESKLHAADYARHCREPRIAGWLAGNARLSEDRIEDANRLRAVGPNVMVLAHGTLKTTSFDASMSRKLVAQMEGELSAARFFAYRRDQAIMASPGQSSDARPDTHPRHGARFPTQRMT